MAKTKELKKRYGARENRLSSVLEAVSRVSGSPFSANLTLPTLHTLVMPQRKITVLGTDYEAELHKRIHPDSLPHFLGGNCRCDRGGGGGCLGQPWEGPWTSRRLSNVSGGHRPVQSPPPA